MLQIVQNEVTELVSEINAVTDRNITIVDDRVKQVRLLMQKSEKLIARSKETHDYMRDLLRDLETLHQDTTASHVQKEQGHDFHEVSNRRDEGDQSAVGDRAQDMRPVEPHQIGQEILRLHNEGGYDTAAIAKKLSVSETEVETALSFSTYKLTEGKK